MVILLTIVHVIVCMFLVVVVLLQSGKAADLAGAFGGMGSQTAFGPRGSATVLSKATTIAAAMFMVTSLTLAILATRRMATVGGSKTVLETTKVPQSGKPATPAVPQQVPPAPTGPPQVSVGEGPVKPGQPSVTLTDPKTGANQTLPLNITPGKPKPENPAQQPPSQPPAKK